MARPLHEIGKEIKKSWPKVNFAAAPYLDAMCLLNSAEDNFGFDSGESIIAYFLSNANSWRGEDAKRIKNELKSMIR